MRTFLVVLLVGGTLANCLPAKYGRVCKDAGKKYATLLKDVVKASGGKVSTKPGLYARSIDGFCQVLLYDALRLQLERRTRRALLRLHILYSSLSAAENLKRAAAGDYPLGSQFERLLEIARVGLADVDAHAPSATDGVIRRHLRAVLDVAGNVSRRLSPELVESLAEISDVLALSSRNISVDDLVRHVLDLNGRTLSLADVLAVPREHVIRQFLEPLHRAVLAWDLRDPRDRPLRAAVSLVEAAGEFFKKRGADHHQTAVYRRARDFLNSLFDF